MQELPLGHIISNVRFGLMHADHQRELAKADRFGGEMVGYEQREGGGEYG